MQIYIKNSELYLRELILQNIESGNSVFTIGKGL